MVNVDLVRGWKLGSLQNRRRSRLICIPSAPYSVPGQSAVSVAYQALESYELCSILVDAQDMLHKEE